MDPAVFPDHFFDHHNMTAANPRQKRDDITRGNAPLRGVTGIRRSFYTVNERLILPEQRQGIKPHTSDLNLESAWLNFDEEWC